jgi:ABC-type phosphate transport system permease subunit
MSRFQALFDALEQKFYHSNREKFSFNIGLLIVLHLLSMVTFAFFAFKVKDVLQSLPKGEQSGEMIAAIPGVMIVGVILFLIALLAGLFIAAMLHHYAAKPLQRVNSIFSKMG